MDFFLRTLSPEVFLRSSSAEVLAFGGEPGLCSAATCAVMQQPLLQEGVVPMLG